MYPDGIKASELIAQLQELVKEHGDRPVYSGGTDYPAGVENVSYWAKGDSYIPKGAFYIETN